ncbi:unnamed protein product [Closterium sp. NIES-54]
MASLSVLTFDHEGHPIQFDTRLDDLQLYLLSDSRDSVSLFDHTSGASLVPPATDDSATCSQWLTRDAGARLAVRNHLPLAERAHIGQHKTAKALYDVVVARYSSPATAALSRLILPYLFPELSAFATVEDLITHLHTSVTRYRTALPAKFLDKNLPPMYITLYFIVTRLPDSLRVVRDHFLALDPTDLTVDLLEKHLLAAETSVVTVGAACRCGSLSSLQLPLFFTNLVSTDALQDAIVTTTTPGGQRVSIGMCTRTGRHLATFTHRHGLSVYTLTSRPRQVAASAKVSASGPVAAPCSCRLLSHQTLLWHHRLGHPSLPHLRGMHSRLLVSGLPRSLPPLPPSPAPPYLPCIEGRQHAAPHSSSFPLTTAPLQNLHMDSFTLPASLQQNGVAECCIGLVMEVARTSMIHVVAPHFLWPFAVLYAAHQLNLWPRVSLSETSPTLRWTGKVGDASVFRVWGSRAFVRDTSADKLSSRAIPCIFLGFPHDAPGWQFYHPTSRRVLRSRHVMFDESVPFYHLFPYRTAPLPPRRSSLLQVPLK